MKALSVTLLKLFNLYNFNIKSLNVEISENIQHPNTDCVRMSVRR
jgi:hypothetical protein